MAEEHLKFGWQKVKGHAQPAYYPSPQEIRTKCQQIQAGWSDRERETRSLFDTVIYADDDLDITTAAACEA